MSVAVNVDFPFQHFVLVFTFVIIWYLQVSCSSVFSESRIILVHLLYFIAYYSLLCILHICSLLCLLIPQLQERDMAAAKSLRAAFTKVSILCCCSCK